MDEFSDIETPEMDDVGGDTEMLDMDDGGSDIETLDMDDVGGDTEMLDLDDSGSDIETLDMDDVGGDTEMLDLDDSGSDIETLDMDDAGGDTEMLDLDDSGSDIETLDMDDVGSDTETLSLEDTEGNIEQSDVAMSDATGNEEGTSPTPEATDSIGTDDINTDAPVQADEKTVPDTYTDADYDQALLNNEVTNATGLDEQEQNLLNNEMAEAADADALPDANPDAGYYADDEAETTGDGTSPAYTDDQQMRYTDDEAEDFGDTDGPVKVLKRDPNELMEAGNSAINQNLEALEDNYRDQGLSEAEIAERLAEDKLNMQQEFLNDAFPGQQVSPEAFDIYNQSQPDATPQVNDTSGADVTGAETVSDTENPSVSADMGVASNSSMNDYETAPETLDKVNAESAGEFAPASAPANQEAWQHLADEYSDGSSGDWDFLADVPFAGDTSAGAQDDTQTYSDAGNQNDVVDAPYGQDVTDTGESSVPDAQEYHYQANHTNRDLQQNDEGIATDSGATDAADTSGVADVQALSDIDNWLGDINPNYDEFDYESPYSNNCGSCAYSVFQRLEGKDPQACASEVNIPYNDEMEALTGMEQVSMSPDEIEQRLLEQGDGAHAIIGVDRAEGAGHWFNAACIDGKVVAIDGQSGEIMDWPPDYGDVVNWEMSVKRS